MNTDCIEYLACPNCRDDRLHLKKYLSDNNEIVEGRIICSICKTWYRIENGIADLLPFNLRNNEKYSKFADKYSLEFTAGTPAEKTDNKRKQIDFFEKNIRDYERDVVNSSFYKALDQITYVDWLKRNLREGQIVLDLGCGTGRQSILLTQHKVRTLGIDISEEMLLLTKQKMEAFRAGHLIDLIVGDAENAPVRNNCFNACIFYGTLHHLFSKDVAIANASKKLIKKGLFFSLDPHKSPVRFIFDFLMKVWKLYDEEASDDPLLSCRQLNQWLSDAGIKSRIKFSTYLPPHIFYILNVKTNVRLLKFSDLILNKIPIIKNLGGVIYAEGVKES